jgi:ADP-ribose pyrophosphatase
MNAGETAAEAAARECEEEIGLVPGVLELMCGLYPAPGFCDEELIFFVARNLAPPQDSTRRPDEDEDITSKVVSVAEARSMVARGDIIDLKTAYGLTLI